MTIKLLIADVDGTLVTKAKALTQITCDAVARLRARGVDFTVTSGRPPRGMARLVAPLKLTAPLAAFNGGMYVKPDLATVLAQRTLAPEVARVAVDFLLQAGLDVWVYQGSEWYLRRADAWRVDRESSNVGFGPTVIADLHQVLDAPVKLVGVSEDRLLVKRCEAELTERLGADASAARSTAFYLDVTHPEANKGMVVREASRILKLPLEDIATIGDMPNDVSMLRVAGMGIAMGNAGPEVQRYARHVTRSNDDEGFAHAVDAFILGAPPFVQTELGLPPRVRACVFALEGVLTQTAALHAKAWKQLFDYYLQRRAVESHQPFVPFDAVHEYRRYFSGQLPLDAVRAFVLSRGVELPEQTLAALVDRKAEVLAELLPAEPVETYEGSVRFVKAAGAAGLLTAVLAPGRHDRALLESAGIARLFDATVEGAPGGAAPEGWLFAAQTLGVSAEQTAVFETSLAGVAAARLGHLGYIAGIDRLDQAAELKSRGADVVVCDLAELLAESPPRDREASVSLH